MAWDDIKHPKFEITVKAMIYDSNRSLLFAQDEVGKWDLPGGRIDGNEIVEDCLKREVLEELGVEVSKISSRPRFGQLILHDDNVYRFAIGFEVEVASLDFKASNENLANKFVAKADFDNFEQCYKGLKTIKDKLYD
jgi:8-oxo-dGTP pyrophosphatase MutT (NUDIX family)